MRYSSILIIILILSCTKEKPKDRNALNIALTTSVSTLDPANSYDTVSAKVVNQIYETLYEYHYLIRPYRIKPLLAQSLPKVENNGLQYTIKLKKNIYYHNSPVFDGNKRKVKAQDFINQFKRLAFIPTRSTGWWLFSGKILGLDEFRLNAKSDMSNFFDLDVEGLQAPNDHTLIIKLKKRYPQLINVLAMAFTTPIPEEAIKFYQNDLSSQDVGTGPYYLEHWHKNSSIKLLKFKDYHQNTYPSKGDRFAYENKLLQDAGKQIPFVDQINFKIIKEAQTRWLHFLNNNTDIIVLTKDHFSLALDKSGKLSEEFKEKNIKLQISPTLTYWWLAMNMNDPILGKNLLLRQALSHAINIDEYIEKFTNNIALKANTIFPPGIPGYSPTRKLPYKYDIKKAKELLAKAGFPNGKGLPTFNYDVRGSSTVSRQMGEFIQKELDKIGIKIKVQLNTFPGFLAKARSGQLQLWPGGWSMDYPDPENVIQLLITKNHPPGPNATFYSNKKVDQYYQDLFLAKDNDEVLEITKKVEDIVNKDLPWIMQYYSRNYILYHGDVKNFRQSDLISNNLKYLRVR